MFSISLHNNQIKKVHRLIISGKFNESRDMKKTEKKKKFV